MTPFGVRELMEVSRVASAMGHDVVPFLLNESVWSYLSVTTSLGSIRFSVLFFVVFDNGYICLSRANPTRLRHCLASSHIWVHDRYWRCLYWYSCAISCYRVSGLPSWIGQPFSHRLKDLIKAYFVMKSRGYIRDIYLYLCSIADFFLLSCHCQRPFFP